VRDGTAAEGGAPAVSVTAPSASAAASSISAAEAGAGACASDDDCRTWSSYCSEAPCGCRVVAKGEAEPKCLGPSTVRCFANPCMGKAARCQNGACVLTPRAAGEEGR